MTTSGTREAGVYVVCVSQVGYMAMSCERGYVYGVSPSLWNEASYEMERQAEMVFRTLDLGKKGGTMGEMVFRIVGPLGEER